MPSTKMRAFTTVILLTILAGCTLDPSPTHSPAPTLRSITPERMTPLPIEPTSSSVEPTPVEPTLPPVDPFALISQDSLFEFLEGLTSIQAYSGWRNSASQGEQEALDYVTARLAEFEFLQELGLELERQSFHVFLGTELRETRLHLSIGGEEIEVPADGLRGHRDEIPLALRFDSDGVLNDSEPDPVVVEGTAVLIRSVDEIDALAPNDLTGKVVFLDYAVVDRVTQSQQIAVEIAWKLLEKGPAGVVLVTRFSNEIGESHGAFVGDLSALTWVETEQAPPTLYVRLEDLAVAGITDWEDLAEVESARLTWDADVFSPATSGNLVARIPGAKPALAIILSAHIDSPNGPGAMDDGSGSVILLEVARVLNEARVVPATDLYLVWFGSEELGLYGASHFVATHQELLDHTLAMLQIDCLTRPLDGILAKLNLVAWSYGQMGDERLPWPEYLSGKADGQRIELNTTDYHSLYSDNGPFSGFDVPNADLIYENEPEMEATGSFHYAGHLHDPYDTVDLTRDVADVLEQMARVVLAAALNTGYDLPLLRVTPEPDHRALFVASHNEAVHMTPGHFIEMGMVLAMEGFDVDMIPYGQAVTSADLQGADLVVVLPVHDYPSLEGDPDLYDEAWSEEEITALEAYVANGGLMILTNSAHRLKYGNWVMDPNEDWSDVNALAGRFGVTYLEGPLNAVRARTEGDNPLVEGISLLEMAEDNLVSFKLSEGQVLARAGESLVVALVDHGQTGGQVLVLADIGLLGISESWPENLAFWQNLARYVRER